MVSTQEKSWPLTHIIKDLIKFLFCYSIIILFFNFYCVCIFILCMPYAKSTAPKISLFLVKVTVAKKDLISSKCHGNI